FLLPSICEGSATATYEALSQGLPVVTTFNSGSPVVDGETGFIVPIRDVESMVDALEALAADRGKLAQMSEAAIRQSRSLNIASYGTRLMQAIEP
ncbi:MAG: glycosyltransferase, partial [Verrucomicrobia bacterium]|nr:glycosyltransferase [Verrucomicrobiota bacterium]